MTILTATVIATVSKTTKLLLKFARCTEAMSVTDKLNNIDSSELCSETYPLDLRDSQDQQIDSKRDTYRPRQ